jgi:hypothetical protein
MKFDTDIVRDNKIIHQATPMSIDLESKVISMCRLLDRKTVARIIGGRRARVLQSGAFERHHSWNGVQWTSNGGARVVCAGGCVRSKLGAEAQPSHQMYEALMHAR